MAQRRAQQRHWYSISVSSLRKGLTMIVTVLALVGAALGYQQWELRTRRDRAEQTIDAATEMARELETRDDYDQLRLEHHFAWQDLDVARTELKAENYKKALSRAHSAKSDFEELLDPEGESSARKSRFLSVEGGVEYRRGESGPWVKARTNDSLNAGDWIKTSDNGTAEFRFPDGTTYVLRHNTLVHLGSDIDSPLGGDAMANLESGWVDVNMAEGGNKIKTPKSEAVLERDTEATIIYDPNRAKGEFTNFTGTTMVTSTSGQQKQLKPLEQVEQQGDRLSEPRPVLPSPRLATPAHNQEIDFDTQREIRLAWDGVDGAQRYALNVARSQVFAKNIIEDERRRRAWARVGVRGEGIFYWRVAALDRQGARGKWSETRSFRIASLKGVADVGDKIPPDLTIEEVQPYGSLVLVNGRTEPGASVTINDEPVSVQLNGSFSKTIQMSEAGFAFVTIVATDAWDNSNKETRRVFIDAL